MLYAGVDTRKKYSRVAVTDSKGATVARRTLQNTEGLFREFLDQFEEPFKAVLEAGRTREF